MESRQIISTMPDHQHDIGESFQEQRTIPIGSARDEGNTTIPADDYTNTGVAPLRGNGFDPHDVHECSPSDHWTVWLALRDRGEPHTTAIPSHDVHVKHVPSYTGCALVARTVTRVNATVTTRKTSDQMKYTDTLLTIR